eukprot:gene10324-2465_t
MSARIRSDGKENQAQRSLNSHKDMRGMTAIRKSEAALRQERDGLLAMTKEYESKIEILNQELVVIRQSLQEKQEIFEEGLAQLHKDHEEKMKTLQCQHDEEIAELHMDHKQSYEKLSHENKQLEGQLQHLQIVMESKGINSITGNSMMSAEELFAIRSSAKTKACSDMEDIVCQARSSGQKLQQLLQQVQALEGRLAFDKHDNLQTTHMICLNSPNGLRNAHTR